MTVPERLAHLTPEQARRRRRLSLELLWACTIFLLPWSIYLMISLPRTYNARHYDVAWAGFDVLELLALGATAYFGLRRRQAIIGAALAAATMLVCDAWFDIALDLGTPGIWGALAAAAFVELPLAGFLIHRVAQLMRLTLVRLYPEADEHGHPMRLTQIPMLVDPALMRAMMEQSAATEQPAVTEQPAGTEQPAASEQPATRPGEDPGNLT
jgi:hypothetical protein